MNGATGEKSGSPPDLPTITRSKAGRPHEAFKEYGHASRLRRSCNAFLTACLVLYQNNRLLFALAGAGLCLLSLATRALVLTLPAALLVSLFTLGLSISHWRFGSKKRGVVGLALLILFLTAYVANLVLGN